MEKSLSFNNSFGKTFLNTIYDHANGWIYNDWGGSLTVDNVIKGATGVLQLLEDSSSRQILNDNRRVIGSWNQANDWIEKEWMPKAIGLGLLRFAHVIPHSLFAKASAEEMLVRVGDKFEMKLFDNIEEAKVWLQVHASTLAKTNV